ncbi:MAG: multicopper oxidase domain-containing protein [Acidobacteriia bacterium]|nr:multicopper oxidase domain-containing protein [Terriglobia bacterium]
MFRCCVSLFCLLPVCGFAQPGPVVANQNRTPAGMLQGGVLNLQLEIRSGAWHPEAEDGPQLFVQAFGEPGHPAQIPGPMLRVPQGTMVHVTVTNQLKVPAKVYGLHTRPGDAKDELPVSPGESRERTFLAGAPGTYYYWARTTVPRAVGLLGVLQQPVFEDAHLNGAFIVDPPGDVVADRVFVINVLLVPPDMVHANFEVVTINGKSYPFTEPLEYTAGDTVRWRVINPGFAEHPMHLHGAFYKLLSLGDSDSDTQFAGNDRQSVVTQVVKPASTMMMEWSPEHVGRWLFHCHFQFHFSKDERVPTFTPAGQSAPAEPALAAHHHDGSAMPGMLDMAGLVLVINVKAPAGAPAAPPPVEAARKIDLVIEPAAAKANEPTFACSVREGKKLVVSNDRAVGPPIVVTRGQPTEITVVNHLNAATSIHWHGIELESYYDGVVGGGVGDQVTPAIAPGASFVARFTPSRAGTFIYHTHAEDPTQLSGGVYGGLIVLEPGQSFDPEHDKLLVIGTRDTFFDAKRITINGVETPEPITLAQGTTYRLRLINMAPNLLANFRLGSQEHPATWRALAKDGADVPARLAGESNAALHIVSGETYDFEYRAQSPGEVPLEILNPLSNAKLVSKIVVR